MSKFSTNTTFREFCYCFQLFSYSDEQKICFCFEDNTTGYKTDSLIEAYDKYADCYVDEVYIIHDYPEKGYTYAHITFNEVKQNGKSKRVV